MTTPSSPLSRRLVAILAADAVGYSGLMAQDEVGTHRITMTLIEGVFNPAIAARQGEVIKHTGDGMLAVFDSVTEAVECAVEIQSELATRKAADGAESIDFRIGINLGDVIVEETDIYGDDVNLASRLEGLAPAGGICVSEDVYHQVHRRIDADFTDAGRHRVKNIPQPVRAYMVSPSGVRLAHSSAQRRRIRKRIAVTTAIVLAGIAAFVGIRFGLTEYLENPDNRQIAVPLPTKPSIAVLPFSYVSSDPAFSYLGDGISEELITGLSRISGLFVIARNSSFAFKGENRRIPDVARALGVRYVVEGSVIVPRAAGAGSIPDRLKINVRLIEGSTGRQLWADAYNDRFDDIVSVQERLSGIVIARISDNLELTPAEPLATTGEVALLRQKDTANPDAYRAFLRGRETARRRTPEAYDRALDDLIKAVTLDPDFVRAHAALSALYLDIRTLGWYADAAFKRRGLDRNATDRKSDYHRRVAMAAASPPPGALRVTARLRARQGRVAVAVKEAQRAVALSPSDAESHARLSLTQSWNGEGAKAIASARAAMRLDPRFPPRYRSYLGIAQFVADDFNAAAASLILAVEGNPANTLARVHLIAALGHLADRAAAAGDASAATRDRRDAAVAIATLNDIRKKTGLQPAVYNISFARNRALYRFDADLNRFIDGLKAAGVP